MKYEIKNRWTGAVQFTAEIKCAEDASEGIKLGLAVRAAVSAGADLRGADLGGAYLEDANLERADLAGAYLAGAYLEDANLERADLAGADLAGAYLEDANLVGANLEGANLEGADLAGAYLEDADLAGAYLEDANLVGAKIRDGITITRAPISIRGLAWDVVIYDRHMQIGCEFHTHDEWRGFSDDDWLRMGGKEALRMKRAEFPALSQLCEIHAAKVPAEQPAEAAAS